MPQLGETVTEGTITRWFKAVGDAVARDEPLFEVSTDKVDSEVPAPAAGTLAEIRVGEGDTVDVGTVLAVIADGASSSAPPAAGAQAPATGSGAGPGSAPPAAGPGSSAEPVPAAPVAAVPSAPDPAPAQAAPATPAASMDSGATSSSRSPAASEPAEPSASSGEGAAEATAPAPSPERSATNGSTSSAMLLSPVVRRLLAENHIDPDSVVGTGPGGRITRSDVLGLIDAQRSGGQPAPLSEPRAGGGGGAISTPSSAPAPAAAHASAGPAANADLGAADDELVPFTNIRRRTAEHMVRSKATSAHTLVSVEADFEAVERARRAHGERFRSEEGFSLTYLPFVAMATVEALRSFAHLNASVGDGALVLHRDVNLGIAVDLAQEGLIVPVIRQADAKRLRALARDIADLSARARTKGLTADDIAGGTFTITNAGLFGTYISVPIINQPQVAIMSTDGVKRRPVVLSAGDGTESIAIHSVGILALSFDHRAVDGSYAAAFMAKVRETIETRNWDQEV